MKRIIIIGATSGIGREVALLYIQAGWRVGIAGRREDLLQELAGIAPDRIFMEVIDVTQEDAPPAIDFTD